MKALVIGLLVALSAGSTSTVLADVAPQPTAAALFKVVEELRSSVQGGSIEDPAYFSREWLEMAIQAASDAAARPGEPSLDWARDTLLSRMWAVSGIESVYAFELAKAEDGDTALRLRALGCNKPKTITLEFRREEGRWRIHRFRSDTTKQGVQWYTPELKPIRSWVAVPARDRSRYLNESQGGKALGLNAKNSRC